MSSATLPALMTFPFDLDPHERDPGGWCASLLHSAEILLGCLDAVQARSVAEVGAFMGELTRLLMLWADTAGGHVVAIDPSPHPDLEQLEDERHDLQLIRETSHEALAHIPLADAIILDGDHNYYTLSEELRIVWQRVGEERRQLPLLLLHDVCWPHGRRDDYYAPERIPVEHRQPIAPDRSVYPDEEGTQYSGLPYRYPAAHEGGPRNGVLTAAEDFAAAHEQLHLAVVPTFFGVGVIWDRSSPHADALTQVVGPWDRNPLLERLERNRVLHLASSQRQLRRAQDANERVQKRDQLLERMLNSRVFRAAEMILRLRHSDPAFSHEEIREVMDDVERPIP
jgi:Methyltransferase domain